MKKLKWKEVLPGVKIPVAGGRHWYHWDITLSILPLWFGLQMDPFGVLHYLSGLINVPLLAGWLLSVLLMPPAVACSVWLLVRMVGVWPRRVYPRRRVLRLWLWPALVFVICFVLPFTGILPAPGAMFVRGFNRHMQAQADVPAIQAWLRALDSNEAGGQSAASRERVKEPEHLPAIARLKPKGVGVSVDEAGRPMVYLSWGSGVIGSWGLIVGHERMPVPENALSQTGDSAFHDAQEYRLRLAPGAYVWYDAQ